MSAPLNNTSPVTFLPLGAVIQEFRISGRNIVLGFLRQQDYQDQKHPYFGETIGRYANRLSTGKVNELNGRDYEFVRNERGITTLHGGTIGWGKKIWNGPQKVTRNERESTLFTLQSPDGDEGFPGAVEARVWYTVEHKTPTTGVGEEVTLNIEYEVEMTGDEEAIKETICCVTNHGYWNIGDGGTVEGTQVRFATDLHLEVDQEFQIPTGKISPYPAVTGREAVDFTKASPAIDDCFVLDTDITAVPLDTRGRSLRRYVTMSHARTGITLEGFTTEPSFQFYSGDGIDVAAAKGQDRRGPRSGIALEPNRYVNAVNRKEWRSLVLLPRGGVWGCKNRFVARCV